MFVTPIYKTSLTEGSHIRVFRIYYVDYMQNYIGDTVYSSGCVLDVNTYGQKW